MNKLNYLMILLLLLLFLTSCTDNQVDWALDVFESWAMPRA